MQAPWYYFVLLLPFVISFVYIPAAVGGILCLLVVHRLPSIRVHALAVGLLAVAGAIIWFVWMTFRGAESDLMTPRWFQDMFARLQFTEQRLLPSWWLSTGLLEASRPTTLVYAGDPPWAQSLMFLVLIVSNAMFFNMLGTTLAGKVYRASYSHLYDEPTTRRSASTWWLDDIVIRFAVLLPREMRVLLIKDFRLFRRDPVQWSQFVIFVRIVRTVFREHPPVQLSSQLLGDDRLFEFGGCGAHPFHIHHAFHFPDGEPRRSQAVDSWACCRFVAMPFCGRSFCSPRSAHSSLVRRSCF